MIGAGAGLLAGTWHGLARWLLPPATERTVYISDRSAANAGMFRQSVICGRPGDLLLSGVVDLSGFIERKRMPRHSLVLEIRLSLLRPLAAPAFDVRLACRPRRGSPYPLRETVGLRQAGADRLAFSLKLQPRDLVAEALHLRWTAIGRLAEQGRQDLPVRNT